MKPIHLLKEELNYELRIRGIVSERKEASQKRKILHRMMTQDADRALTFIDPLYAFETERIAIDRTLESIKNNVDEFEGPKSDSAFLRIVSRLIHITNRVRRMPIPEENPEEVATFKNESLATCVELEAIVYDKVEGQTTNEFESSFLRQSSNPHDLLVSVAKSAIAQAQSRKIDIHKWGLKFDGTPSQLNAFLERVKELAAARGVSEENVFLSAVDLFSGHALLWYRSIKNTVKSWEDVVTALRRDFLPSNYDDKLWEEIKTRTQGRGEPIHIYIAIMESLFGRLSRPALEKTKIKIVKHNLLPHYASHLALIEFDSVANLAIVCRKLDEASAQQKKYQPPPGPSKFLESDLAYIDTASSSSPSVREISSSVPKTRSKSNLVCWNCQKPNHTFSECRLTRKRFCFRCGKPGCTVKSCTVCSKN